MDQTILNNPRVQQLISLQSQILENHKFQVQKLKDHLFFGMRFESQQQLQKTTSIFTNTMIALQCLSGAGSLYMLYRKRYLPTFIMTGLVFAFGQPTQYLLRKNNYIQSQLDKLQSQTQSSLKKISDSIQEIIVQQQRKEQKKKGFFGKLFNSNKSSK